MVEFREKILFIIGQLGLGGAEKQLFLLIKGLQEKLWDITLITLNPNNNDYWEQPIRELGVPIFEIRTELPKIIRLLKIASIIHKIQPRIVHSWSIHANFYAAFGGLIGETKIRIGSERANHNSSKKSLGQFYYWLSFVGLSGLITNNENERAYLNQVRPRLNTYTVKNGIEFLQNSYPREEVRLNFNLLDNEVGVCSIGSLVERKNFSFMIKIARNIVHKYPQVKFFVIGDGPLRERLQLEINENFLSHNFFLLGSIPNAERYLLAFDIFCFPSFDQEGMPNVLMEASAAGLPVVASNVGSVNDIVNDKETGFLVKENDIYSFEKRLKQLILEPDLRVKMGENGRKKIKSEFSSAKFTDSMVEVYMNILQDKFN
jgi:glycosyltransferase involved in cell wall biosynthesis